MTVTDWIIVATALLAFFRPELELLARQWLAKLDVHPVGSIELGFGGSGLTLALEGTVRAKGTDAFIESASVTVSRDDGATRHLPWAGLRPRRVVASLQPQDIQIVSPVASQVPKRFPQYYYIVFAHPESRETIAQLLGTLRQELTDKMQAAGVAPFPDPDSQAAVRQFEEKFLNDLLQSGRFQDTVNRLDRECFWTVSRYSVTLEISCSDPRRVYTFRWPFDLTEEQAERLHQNAKIMLFQNFGHLDLRLNTVEVEYGEERKLG